MNEKETRRDTGATRRDGGRETNAGDDPAETRRDASGAAGEEFRTGLPASLAERFTVIEELAAGGAEADVLRVRDATGDFVLKVYRSGVRASGEVWDQLARLEHPNLVRIHETGTAGRDFELVEYAPGGALGSLPDSTGRRLATGEIHEVVRQVSAGLETLHEVGIVHRDLKPSNVLVRSLFPLDLAITDFGISKVLDQSQRFTSRSRTAAYAPPEAQAGHVSPAWDWWSLGMLVRQLATGERPFAGVSEAAVIEHLSTRPIDVEGVADERVRLLCRGLLVKDPERRWDVEQVRAWLDGASPEVVEESEPAVDSEASQRWPLPFDGSNHVDRESLALALAEDWQTAARRFFTNMGTRENPSEAWRLLRDWLTQFDDPRVDDVEGRIVLIDEYLTSKKSPDEKLTRLLAWLHPGMPPIYCGMRMLPADVAGLASQALGGDHTAAQTVDTLWQHEVLALLAGFPGGEELAEIDQRWRSHYRQWEELLATLAPQVRQGLEQQPARYALLHEAAVTDSSLASWAWEQRDRVTASIEWFDTLARDAEQHQNPTLLLAMGWAAAFAHAEQEKQRKKRQQEKHQEQQNLRKREEQWHRKEERRLRLDRRIEAVFHALLGLVSLVVVFVGVGLTTNFVLPWGDGPTVAEWSVVYYWTASLIAFVIAAVAQIWTAWVMGGFYDYEEGPLQILIPGLIVLVLSVFAAFFWHNALITTRFLLPVVVAVGVPLYTVLHYRDWKYNFQVWQYNRYIEGHKDVSDDESW